MSKLSDAEKAVGKLEDKANGLRGKLGAAQAEQQVLEGQRAELERRAFGCDDADAESELDRVAAALAKNAAQQRGVSSEFVSTVESLNAAREVQRAAQLEADAVTLRKLDKDIGRLRAELAPLEGQRAAIVGGRVDAATTEDRARHSEAEELQSAVEAFAGCTVTRRIESEVTHYAP